MAQSGELMEDNIFPCLPYGFKPTLGDMTGWVSHIGPKQDGRINMVKDLEVKAHCAEITCGGNNETTAISFPDHSQFIGTKLPFLTLHIKNMERYVTVSVEMQGSDGQKKTLKCTNHQSVVRLSASTSSLPLDLRPGWNKVVLDLSDLVRRIFKCEYSHCLRVKVHANCRVRRIFFSDKNYKNKELPISLRV